MNTKKPYNCAECGHFFSTEDLYPLCKKCFDLRCNNCWEPHLIPAHLLHIIPHFCDSDCEAEFNAREALIKSAAELINSLNTLRKENYRMFKKNSYQYHNSNLTYTNNADTEETIFFLKVKHNSQQDQGLELNFIPRIKPWYSFWLDNKRGLNQLKTSQIRVNPNADSKMVRIDTNLRLDNVYETITRLGDIGIQRPLWLDL